MLHVTLRVRLTSSLHHPKKNRSSITPQRECKILCDFLYRAARFVRFLVEWYKSAISSAFPPVSPKVKIKMLIIIYLQGLLQKAAKSGGKWFVRNLAMRDVWPPLLQCYNVTMLHVTLRLNALRPSALRREGGEGRGAALAGGQEGDRIGLGRRAGGRQEWPWQEGERDRGADR